MDVIARLPGCDGQAADAVSACTQVKLEDASQIAQNVQMYGYVFQNTNGPNLGQTLKIQWFLLNEICTDTHLRDSYGRDSLRKFYWNLDGGKYRIGNVFLFIENQGLFLSVYVDSVKTAGKKQKMAPMWKKLMKNVDLDEPTSVVDHEYLACTQRECKPNEALIERCTKKYG